MTKRTGYFAGAGSAALAAVVFLIFNQGENVVTAVALCVAWAVIMLVLGFKQTA